MHLYLHVSRRYRAVGALALAPFAFEGSQPHVQPNTASGKDFQGAVRYGHFYVVVDKIGTLFNWTDYPPFRRYAVVGWWLDNFLKPGKITRSTYLDICAQVGVGFQHRLVDVRAAELYEKDRAVEQACAAERQALRATLKPTKVFPEVTQYVSLFGPRSLSWSQTAVCVIARGQPTELSAQLETRIQVATHKFLKTNRSPTLT